MAFLSAVIKPVAKLATYKNKIWAKKPLETQMKVFRHLIAQGKITKFGQEHQFSKIKNYKDFKNQVPIADYEDIKPYIELIKSGQPDVLWPGKPLYFAKTSGTTSGTKYIPITKESIPYHISAARDALFSYVAETGKADFFDRKMIFLSGSPEIENVNGIYVGRLSGIVNHHVPKWLHANRLPSWETNCIEDWEKKIDTIVKETITEDMGLISGIPPWVQMYFDKIEAATGKKVSTVFQNFNLFVYGGVNFEPYRAKLVQSIGKTIDSIETYPASEGFIAYQDSQNDEGMLLLLNSGMFYEFVPADEYYKPCPARLHIGEVETGVNYALIINSNAGLWGYSIGDTIKFVSKNPYKIVVTGRIKHFISAFGEHVIGEEVEKALKYACTQFADTEIVEFTVAPRVVNAAGQLPCHEWYIEFAKLPHDVSDFSLCIDREMQKLNSYYYDLIVGNVLQTLVVKPLKKGTFIQYMKNKGKLGGQNKVPRLSNTREIADELEKYVLK